MIASSCRLRVWLRLLGPEGSMTWASRNNRDMGDIKSTSSSGIKKRAALRIDTAWLGWIDLIFTCSAAVCFYSLSCTAIMQGLSSGDQLSCLLVYSSLPSSSSSCFHFKYGSLFASSSLKLMSLLLPPPPPSFTASSAFS